MLELVGRLAESEPRVGGILDIPFEDYVEECGDEAVANVFRGYARAHQGCTLRHVLRDPRFRSWVQSARQSKARLYVEVANELLFVDELVATEATMLEAPKAPKAPKVATANATSGTGENRALALLRAAEEAGVTARLRDAASVLAPRMHYGPLRSLTSGLRRTTVRDLLEGRIADANVRIGGGDYPQLAALAMRHIEEAIERGRAERRADERIAALAHVPSGEGARAFLTALDTALARYTRTISADITFASWRMLPAPVRLEAITTTISKHNGRSKSGTMTLTLEDWRARPIAEAVTASAKDARTADCTHAFLRSVRRLFADPEHPLYAGLVRFLDQPAWERIIAKARTLQLAAPSAPKGELMWRVMKGATLRLEAVLRADGAPRTIDSRSATLPLESLIDGRVAASARDERIARALLGSAASSHLDPYYSPYSRNYAYVSPEQQNERLVRAFSLLAGAPHVVLWNGSPLSVVEGDIEVAIEEETAKEAEGSEDGYRIRFSVGGESLSPRLLRESLDERGELLCLDAARGLMLVSHAGTLRGQVLAALASEEATFPETARAELVERVIAFADLVPIALPPSLVGEIVEGDSRPLVRVSRPSVDSLLLAWLVRPLAGGPVFEAGKGAAQLVQQVGGRTVATRRSLGEEKERSEALKATLPAPERSHGMREVLATIEALRAAAETGAAVIEWPKSVPSVVGRASWSKTKLIVSHERDWFGVNGKVNVAGETITVADLLAARRSGESFVVVGPDRLVELEGELQARLADLEAITRAGAKGLALPRAALPAFTDMLASREQLDAGDSFWKLLARIDAATASEPKVPRTFSKVLRAYQSEGFRWMMRLAAWGGGACLADEMGLGKTVQTLALLVARREEGPALVVAPTSVGPNWIAEAKRFAPKLRTILHRGAERDTSFAGVTAETVLVTSYDVLVRDAEAFSKMAFATVVLDEAQAIKNGGTARARAARSLRADFRLALTGTPVENRLGELHSLMEFLNPDFFGSEDAFRNKWVLPIERDKDPIASAALARVVRPFILRRTKSAVLTELPPRTEIQRTIEPSPAERKRYEAARQLALAALAGEDESGRFRVLAEIMRLRRLACHPRLDDAGSTIESSKLATFLELVGELREAGHRALVFSQFTDHLALVEEALRAQQIPYLYLDGKTPLAERTRRVKAFQAGEGDLFLISLKAGGTGLNLTAADTVIHLDPWWNPAVEDQASDRAHRIGQKRAVTVIRLIAQGTIEEAVVALHAEKRQLAESILEGTSASGKLSIAELGALIREGG